MAQKIRGFWFRLYGFLLATFCTVGSGKTAYAECPDACKQCCSDLTTLQNDLDDSNPYKTAACVERNGKCYLQGLGGATNAYLTDEAGKFYYKTKVYCASDGNWMTSS